MKYINFKRYKFSTVKEYLNFKRYKFLKVFNLRKYNFQALNGYFNFKKYKLLKIYKIFDLKEYKFNKILRKINYKNYKYLFIYFLVFIALTFLIYLSIPSFYNYNKSNIESVICKNLNINCQIKGKVNYSFFPSPRIKLKNFIIKDFSDNNKTLGKIENVAIKISIYNLLDKNKFKFTNIKLENAKINLDLNNLSKYKDFFKKKFKSRPINLKEGEINFFEGKKFITSINKTSIKYDFDNKKHKTVLKGNFLGDQIYVKNINYKNDENLKNILIFKLLELQLYSKVQILNPSIDNDTMNGNFLFKKNKNRITAIFNYKDDQIIIKHANVRNTFLEGKLQGIVKFLPHFGFDLNLDLNIINFNRLHNVLVNLSDQNKKKIFKINKKINGKLNLTADKIFSRHTLINSIESRIRFNNGDILFEQLLLSLGKFGAADIIGIIKDDEKFINFKFENNIFLDNLKRFYNKFGIFNKENASSNLFVAGNLDLVNLKMRFNEISNDEKFNEEEVEYIEKEFNDLLLENGYTSLFNFKIFKEFIKSIVSEIK